MALSKFETDIANIQKLDDEPNDVGGLTAQELKAEFDKAGLQIQEYINDTLIPGIGAEITTAVDQKVIEISSADMQKAVYDPQQRETDVFAYVDGRDSGVLRASAEIISELGLASGAAIDDTLRKLIGFSEGAALERLYRLVTTEAAAQIDIDLSHIDFNEYSYIKISGFVKTAYNSAAGVVMRINNDSSSSYSVQVSIDGGTSATRNYMAIMANRYYDMFGEIILTIANNRPICRFTTFGVSSSAVTSTLCGCYVGSTGINSVNFLLANGGNTLPGSELSIYGLKK